MSTELAPILSKLRSQFEEKPELFHGNLRYLLARKVPPRGSRFNLDHHDMCLYIARSKNANVVVYQAKYKPEHSDNLGEGGENVNSGVRTECTLHPTETLHPMWIKLEPEHVARRRARGETDDRCELNMIEKKMAFGCSTSPLSFNAFCEAFFAQVQEKKSSKSTVVDYSVEKANPKKLTPEQEAAALNWWKAFQPHLVKFVAVPKCPVLMLSLKPVQAENAASPPAKLYAGFDSTSSSSSWFSMGDSVPVLLTIIQGRVCILEHIYVASTEPKHFYQLPKVDYIDFFGYTVGESRDAQLQEDDAGGDLLEERKTS